MTQDDDGSAPMLGSHPVAWGAVASDGSVFWVMRSREDVAGHVASGTEITPLYRHPQPALTDAEREAIERAMHEAFLEYKRLARVCGVTDGIDLPAVAMAFKHGVAHGQKQSALTDAEREAIENAIGRELDAEWYGGPEPERVTTLRRLLGRLG